MAYIYCITNDINNKQYIGQTVLPIEERFRQHCKDSQKVKNEKRPLYNAMQKYGIEHFHIEVIEETEISKLNEREIFWIKELNTYYNGYNATLGGDGKHLMDYDLISETYLQLLNQKKTAELLNISVDTVRLACHINNIPILKQGISSQNKSVEQYDKNNNYIQTFYSYGEAARYLINLGVTSAKVGTVTNKIAECANKSYNRKSAYGYIWRDKSLPTKI